MQLFPVGSLFSIFLGYSLYLLIFVLGAYIQGALFNQLSQLGLILFLLQVTGCIIVVITMVRICRHHYFNINVFRYLILYRVS